MSIYFCPTASEVEQNPGGGFTVCCDAPERHVTREQISEVLRGELGKHFLATPAFVALVLEATPRMADAVLALLDPEASADAHP